MNRQALVGILGACAAASIAGVYYVRREAGSRAVQLSQDRFRAQRAEARQRAAVLGDLAADLHIAARPSLRRIGATSMLTDDGLSPAEPVPLDTVRVVWDSTAPPDYVRLRRLARRVLPKRSRWRRFARYSDALGTLMRPALFEDRPSFRVVGATWRSGDGPLLVLGRGTYFDMIDQAEPMVHELLVASRGAAGGTPNWRRLPIRAVLKADPYAFGSRVALVSVGTLTIRRTPDGEGTFFLLHRKAGEVAVGEDCYGVVPAGMFQPVAPLPADDRSDLSIWRNIMREYNEELLGAPEVTAEHGADIDYSARPYRDLEHALATGGLRVWSFGMAMAARDLIPIILTAAVFEADVFDRIFASLVDANEEGAVLRGPGDDGTVGLPLREADVAALMASPKLDPPAAASLHLALRYRDLLLAPPANRRRSADGGG